MMKIEDAQINAHKAAVGDLYLLDPETQAHQHRISNFLLKYPELTGISYASAEMIMKEKDPYVRTVVIKRVSAEIKHRKDVDASGYRITYATVTSNQVQRILNNEKQKRTPKKKEITPQKKVMPLKCPHCKKIGLFEEIARSEVVAFRATEVMDDAIDYLARKCCISKSSLISELLFIEKRFGSGILIT